MKGLTLKQRAQLKADIVEYRKQGHCIRECCEHFDVSKSYVYRSCSGIDYPWVIDIEAMRNAAIKQAAERTVEVPTAYLEIIAPWAEYIEGYTHCDGFMTIKCKTCGTVMNKSCVSIRKGTAVCLNCKKTRQEQERVAKETAERIAKAETKRIEKIRSLKCKQQAFKACSVCGNVFIPSSDKQINCSVQCAHKAKNKRHDAARRSRLDHAVVDTNISLEALYKRDKGICYICGKQCDWDDYHYSGDIFIADNYYPSVDHVNPLAKGGLHSWSNVRLAHKICNSKKGAQLHPLVQNNV